MKFAAAVAPVAVPSETSILEGEAFATALNPVPDVPEDPLDPEVPDEPDDPEVPDDPDEPLEPDVPDEPLEPDVPEEPEDPDAPDVPEDPDVPDLPAIDISTRIVPPVEGVHPVPETYETGNSQYDPLSTGFPVTVK